MSDQGVYFIVGDPEDFEDFPIDLYITTTLEDARETLYNKCKPEFTGFVEGYQHSFFRSGSKSIVWVYKYPGDERYRHHRTFRIVSRAMQNREFNLHDTIEEIKHDVDPLGRFPEQ